MPGSGFPWEQKTPPNFSMKIDIPEDCTHINILFSGGADSTLLTYLLLKQYPETPVILHYMKNRLFPHQQPFMIQTHEWLNSHFQKQIPINQWGKTYIRLAVETILHTFPGYVFSGCNKVPDNVFTPTVIIPHDTPPVRGPAYSKQHLRPFIEMFKPEIYHIYQKETILDLWNLTFSCGRPIVSDEITPCGGCFFCMERNWAMQPT